MALADTVGWKERHGNGNENAVTVQARHGHGMILDISDKVVMKSCFDTETGDLLLCWSGYLLQDVLTNRRNNQMALSLSLHGVCCIQYS